MKIKTKCEKYFDVITNKVSDIINYLHILKKCIDKLGDNDKKQALQINKINKRLCMLEERLDSLQDQHETMEIIKNSLGEEIKVCLNEKTVELYNPKDFSKIHKEVIRVMREDNSSKEEKK